MSDKRPAAAGSGKDARELDKFGNLLKPRIVKLDLFQQSSFLPTNVRTTVEPDGVTAISKRDFERLIQREKAINQLYLCRESSITRNIIFPINVNGRLLNGWAQIEQVAASDRAHALNMVRAARLHALYLSIDFRNASKQALEEGADDAIGTYTRLLQEDREDELER